MNNVDWSDEYGYVSEGKVYLKGYFDFPDREIGEVRQSIEASVEYFRKRYEVAQQKVAELYTLVETAQNKGSYLMKLVHLRNYFADYDALGDFPALYQKLDVLEEDLRKNISVNRDRNLEIKQALLLEAEPHRLSEEWKEAADKLHEIKEKWIKTGAVAKELEEEIEGSFRKVLDDFFARRKDFFNQKMLEQKTRMDSYMEIIYQAERLKYSQDWDATVTAFKALQERWKNVGKLPPDKVTKLWKRFRKATDIFFERYNQAKGLPPRFTKRVDPKQAAQEKMTAEAESLFTQPDMNVAAERAKALLMEWKNLNVPSFKQDRALGERFRLACDKIFEMNYLMRVIKRKHFFFEKKSKEEQLTIKVATMSDLVRKDKQQLELQESEAAGGSVGQTSSYNRQGYGDDQNQDNKRPATNLNVQKRKIQVKENLLNQFKNELAEIRTNRPYR
ncbi:DUF349 domain-containing protein [Cytophagaceae bacterium DM2B3-1]|uniref:DUF349 domain-containing protein n=1 Tax=Xanthocytophaga flava TaxID=3048013 RepID=A0ABT7CP80_9BACT|nr:DUF349 domain-containing protein [Xanthocytophaga flavus]MDJ1468115.1 DUF349 domain-containing protein [Xanthocytophaga flavus]MDJ1494484.1 DUF349 domain-containing protein [Xanthocytophaga flavus]